MIPSLRIALLMSVGLFFGCKMQAQTVTINVGINQPAALVANAGDSTGIQLCEGDTVTLGGAPTVNGGTAPYIYAWSPGTDLSSVSVANPSAWPAGNATYALMVTDSNNCTSNSSVALTVNTVPAASFNSTPAGLVVAFTDQSTGTITGWSWDFGDGGTSTLQNPSHTYASAGQYLVCLTADNNGCSSTSCTTLAVLVGLDPATAIPDLSVYPNPFNGSTQVHFSLTEAQLVRVVAFDVQGKLIGVVSDGMRNAGDQAIRFNVADFGAPAGIYFLRVTVGEKVATLRVQALR